MIDKVQLNALFLRPRKHRQEILVELHKLAVIACEKLRVPEGEREDLVEAAYERMVEKRGEYDPARQRAFGYFVRIGRNAAINEMDKVMRRRRRHSELTEASASRVVPMTAPPGPPPAPRKRPMDWHAEADESLREIAEKCGDLPAPEAMYLQHLAEGLQALRFRVLKTYLPLTLPGIRWTLTRVVRMEGADDGGLYVSGEPGTLSEDADP